ncbi:MAG: hypothetical protein JSV98_03595 [candidate division WOR-3 bacterium]|nr:MAG: hypothetical protein JSV98_03595 [candidate division WOR-3 bacterium]
MKILIPLYLKLSKKKFSRSFKPLGAKRKLWHLVSVPENPAEFFKAAPFLVGLSKIGSVVMLMPKSLETIRSFMKAKQFEVILYEKKPSLFSEDYKRVAVQLGNRHFHFLIELNQPANVSLPYLGNIQRRVSFFDKSILPYYNILVKDSYASLLEFFNIQSPDGQEMFHFYSRDLKATEKKLKVSHPLLFVNEADTIDWDGNTIVVGKDIMADDPAIWKVLYGAEAYYGKQDAFYEFALLYNKEILNK